MVLLIKLQTIIKALVWVTVNYSSIIIVGKDSTGGNPVQVECTITILNKVNKAVMPLH